MIILKVGEGNLKEILRIAAKAIKAGKVVICPTDTVYGLVADATNKAAVGKVFQIKKREKSKSVPIFVKDIASARKLAEIDKNQEKLLRSVWPGKTTAVLNYKSQITQPRLVK